MKKFIKEFFDVIFRNGVVFWFGAIFGLTLFAIFWFFIYRHEDMSESTKNISAVVMFAVWMLSVVGGQLIGRKKSKE